MHNSQCTIHNAQFTMHNSQCAIHNFIDKGSKTFGLQLVLGR